MLPGDQIEALHADRQALDDLVNLVWHTPDSYFPMTMACVQIEALHADKRGLDKLLAQRQDELDELHARLKASMVRSLALQFPFRGAVDSAQEHCEGSDGGGRLTP